MSREKWPNDFDLCFDPQGMNSTRLPPELLDVSEHRAGQKALDSGEGLSSPPLFDWKGRLLREMFGLDKEHETPKGLLVLLSERLNKRGVCFAWSVRPKRKKMAQERHQKAGEPREERAALCMSGVENPVSVGVFL